MADCPDGIRIPDHITVLLVPETIRLVPPVQTQSAIPAALQHESFLRMTFVTDQTKHGHHPVRIQNRYNRCSERRVERHAPLMSQRLRQIAIQSKAIGERRCKVLFSLLCESGSQEGASTRESHWNGVARARSVRSWSPGARRMLRIVIVGFNAMLNSIRSIPNFHDGIPLCRPIEQRPVASHFHTSHFGDKANHSEKLGDFRRHADPFFETGSPM
jgi:hypothetical protein